MLSADAPVCYSHECVYGLYEAWYPKVLSLFLLLAEIFFFFLFVLEVLDVSAVKRWKGDEVRSINYDKQTCDFTELLIVTSGFENNSINNSKSFIKPN